MIDIHAHFADEGYEFPAEWEKINAAGIKRVVLASDTLEHAKWHADFAKNHDGCYFTVGIHPSEAGKSHAAEIVDCFTALAADKKCIAVGEIGLDYHYEGFDKEAQKKLFVLQILLADELGLPLQIHSRDACADTLAILSEQKERLGRGFLMHCYSYVKENMDDFIKLGAYFSFGGVTCFKNARRVVESVEHCPISRILSETDSPYLSPFRGEKNTPANIPVIVRRLAQIKGVSEEEMSAAIEENAERLFPKLN